MLIDMMILPIIVLVKMVIMIMVFHFVFHVIGDVKNVNNQLQLVHNVKELIVILINHVNVMINFMKLELI